MERDAMLNVRIPSDVKEAIRRAGDDDHGRSISAMTVRILREWLTDRGYIEPEAPRTVAKSKGRK